MLLGIPDLHFVYIQSSEVKHPTSAPPPAPPQPPGRGKPRQSGAYDVTQANSASRKQRPAKKAAKPRKREEEDDVSEEEIPTKSHESHGTVRSNHEKARGQGHSSEREGSSQSKREKKSRPKAS